MVPKNPQARRLTTAGVELAIRAVEGVPNAIDMDFSGVDADPTSLDLGAEGDGFAADETPPNHRHAVEECMFCGQPLGEE